MFDQIYLCGDYNGRIGELSDTVEGIHTVPQRTQLDKIVHGHDEPLIDFMQDTKLCVLHLNPENDNYTCISTIIHVFQQLYMYFNNYTCISPPRSASVVDYIITPHDVYYKCQTFNIYTMTELMDKCNLSPLIGNKCKPTQYCMYNLRLLKMI